MHKRTLIRAAAALALAIAAPAFAQGGSYPDKPLKIIVPYPPGGFNDTLARTLGAKLQAAWGQTVVVDNKPGGATVIGLDAAAKAPPDGYTLVMVTISTHGIAPAIYPRLPYDVQKDFAPIANIGLTPQVLMASLKSGISSVQDLITKAKAGGDLNYGSSGNGSASHLAVEMLRSAASIKLTHVPFKGNADLQQALLGGHVAAQSDATGWDKFVDNGQMRLLATFGETRTKRWPQVPTVKELGYGVVSTSPYGLAGPKGMEPAVVKILHDAFRKALDDPKNLEVMAQLNQEVWYRSGDDYAKWARETFVKDKVLIEKLGLAAK